MENKAAVVGRCLPNCIFKMLLSLLVSLWSFVAIIIHLEKIGTRVH